MSQTNCPRCNDPVRFPADLPGEAIVRCPLCTEEFAFSEVEASLPPMVEVISLPRAADEVLSNMDELLSAKPVPGSIGLVAAPRVTSTTVRRSTRRRPAESPWRPLILFAEIVLSGIVGIALAVLVLWWLPGQWHRDPLSLKPVASKYAPWLLPPAHRPLAEHVADEDQAFVPSRKSSPNSAAKPSAAKPQNQKPPTEKITPPDSRPASFEESDPAKPPSAAENSSKKPPIEVEEPETPDLDNDRAAIANKQGANPSASTMSDLTKGLPADHWLNQPEAPPEPPDLAWTGSPEITALLRDAERRRKNPPKPNFDFPERTEPDFQTTFHELARVSGQASVEDVGLEAARERLTQWLASLSSAEWKAALEKTAETLPKESIAPRGVIYLAKLKAAAAEGSWLHLELQPNPGDPTFPILVDPALFRGSGGENLLGQEIYLLASELPDPKRLVIDVPGGVKKTWLIGALRLAEQEDRSQENRSQEDKPSSPEKSAF